MSEFFGLTDTHAHLSFLAERDVAVQDIAAHLEVFDSILDIGTNAGDLPDRIAAFGPQGQTPLKNVRFAAGIWPHKADIRDRMSQIERLCANIEAAPSALVAAIGECGFDRRENQEPSSGETELFCMQLEAARRYKKPVIVHTREAAAQTQETLAAFKDVQAIIHCYSYGVEDAKKFLDLGCYISFAGNLTFKNAQNLREAIKVVPHERLLFETDCPYLAPVPHRGKTATPLMILETYKMAAELLSVDIEDLKHTISENARTVFGQNNFSI
ncbi:MAG: TatD family hydrolase [Termitinemataceae bacterium]|nr:MAG: TatD family hydrolase [Termitinemataceae bacterium]